MVKVKTEYIFLGLIIIIYIVYKLKFSQIQKEKRLIKKEKREIQRENRAIARENKMLRKKADVGGIIFTVILGILYIPFSIFSMLGVMVSGGTIEEVIRGMDLNRLIFLCMPVICLISIISAIRERIKHRGKIAAFVQIVPLIVFTANFIAVIVNK